MLLGGCYDLPNQLQGPIAIREGESGLEIALCVDVDARNLILEVRTDGQWNRAWVAQGGATVPSGQVVTAESIGDLFSDVTIIANDFSKASDFSVVVTAITEDDNIVAGFDAARVESIDWLHPDNSLSADACTA
jgi:hypothetical protein